MSPLSTMFLVFGALCLALCAAMFAPKASTPQAKVKRTTRDERNGHLETRVLFTDGSAAIYLGHHPFGTDFMVMTPLKVFRPRAPVIGHVPYE